MREGGGRKGGGGYREDRLAGCVSLWLWLAPLCMDSDVVVALGLLHLSRVGELE